MDFIQGIIANRHSINERITSNSELENYYEIIDGRINSIMETLRMVEEHPPRLLRLIEAIINRKIAEKRREDQFDIETNFEQYDYAIQQYHDEYLNQLEELRELRKYSMKAVGILNDKKAAARDNLWKNLLNKSANITKSLYVVHGDEDEYDDEEEDE